MVARKKCDLLRIESRKTIYFYSVQHYMAQYTKARCTIQHYLAQYTKARCTIQHYRIAR